MKSTLALLALLGLAAASAPAVAPAAQSCTQPDKPAGVLSLPTVHFPAFHGSSPAHGTIVLRVDLNARGEMVGHEFMETSGNPHLDLAALQAAHRAKFSPEVVNCRPVAGSYLFVVVFPES